MARTQYGLPGIYNSSAVTLTDGEGTALATDNQGRLAMTDSPSSTQATQFTQITTSTAETTIVTAAAAGLKINLYGLIIGNSSASATNVTIKDSTSGTTRAIISIPAGETKGFVVSKNSGLPQATAANNWTATSSASVSSVNVTAMYTTYT